MRKLVLVLMALIAVATFIRAYSAEASGNTQTVLKATLEPDGDR